MCRTKWITLIGLILLGGQIMTEVAKATEDSVMLFPIVKDGKWGYMDKAGKVAIEPEYQLALDFHEGLACIAKDALRGYIDKTGKIVIKRAYGWAGNFREGRARVNLHKNRYGDHVEWYRATGGWGYIDKTGKKPSFKVTYGARPCDVVEGKIWTGKDYLGLDGKKIAYDGDEGSSFSEGLAAARKGAVWGYIDHTMKFKIAPSFVAARAFSDGLAAVAKTSLTMPAKVRSGDFLKWMKEGKIKWGYIDKAGKMVIDCTMEDAWTFSEGLAPVRIAGKWGYINKTGVVVVKPEYDFAWSFSEGLARVLQGEKYAYIDKAGKVVIPPKYDVAWEFFKGLARVGVGEKEGYIDHAGKYVWEPTE